MEKNNKVRESFVFYRSFFEAIEEVEPKDQLLIYQAIAKYSLDRKEPKLSGVANVIWKLIKPQIDANWHRYEKDRSNAPLGNRIRASAKIENPKWNDEIDRIDKRQNEIKKTITCIDSESELRPLMDEFKRNAELRNKLVRSLMQ